MFFETALGYYESRSNLSSRSVSFVSSGAFQGVEESISARSSGIGYRAAVGIEIPVAYDFYVTAAYASNAYELKAVKVSSSNEKGSFFTQQQQVEFGIAYYNN
jgi:hypothetical protein